MCLNLAEAMVLSISSGKLTACSSSEKGWRVIDGTSCPFHDVILFEDKLYAVDSRGRMVNVGLDLGLTEVAGPVFGGEQKFLVESLGELLLADLCLNMNAEYEGPGFSVTFKVYRFDSKKRQWVEIRDIGDRVLFLGEDGRFSASSSELNSCKGNCILFNGDIAYAEDDDGSKTLFPSRDLTVFDMVTGRMASRDDSISYSELFWPPPEWIMSMAPEVEGQSPSSAL